MASNDHLKIGVWHYSQQKLDGKRLRTHPAGGTETAIVYTCEALARTGASVHVFCHTDVETSFEGVRYVPSDRFRSEAAETEFDAFIIVRHLVALTVPIRTRGLFYWAHDNLRQPFLHSMFRFNVERGGEPITVHCFGLGEMQERFDAIFAVSRWQGQEMARTFELESHRLAVIGNGLQPGLFDPDASIGEKKRVILYSLPPDRGLLPLLEIFAKGGRRLHKAELHLYSRSTIYGVSEEEDLAAYGELYKLADEIPGVRHFDPVDQPTLARAMSEAMVYAYPTDTEETFCISILEAQAAGTVPISTSCGAIPERISAGVDGYLVAGDPTEEDYQRRFLDRLSRLLRDDDVRNTMADAARRRAFSDEYSYDSVAARMLQAMDRGLQRDVRTAAFDWRQGDLPYSTNAGKIKAEGLEALEKRFQGLVKLGEPPA